MCIKITLEPNLLSPHCSISLRLSKDCESKSGNQRAVSYLAKPQHSAGGLFSLSSHMLRIFLCPHAFAKNVISTTWNKFSLHQPFHLPSSLPHTPHSSSQVSDRPHPSRVGLLWFCSAFVLVSLLILLIRLLSLSISIPVCCLTTAGPSLSCVCSLSLFCPSVLLLPLSSAMPVTLRHLLPTFQRFSKWPQGLPASPDTTGRVEWWGGAGMGLRSEPFGSNSGFATYWLCDTGQLNSPNLSVLICKIEITV